MVCAPTGPARVPPGAAPRRCDVAGCAGGLGQRVRHAGLHRAGATAVTLHRRGADAGGGRQVARRSAGRRWMNRCRNLFDQRELSARWRYWSPCTPRPRRVRSSHQARGLRVDGAVLAGELAGCVSGGTGRLCHRVRTDRHVHLHPGITRSARRSGSDRSPTGSSQSVPRCPPVLPLSTVFTTRRVGCCAVLTMVARDVAAVRHGDAGCGRLGPPRARPAPAV